MSEETHRRKRDPESEDVKTTPVGPSHLQRLAPGTAINAATAWPLVRRGI
ncbi:hypothetical protein [Corynebacterium phocae]|nr:hypothetical protein [Corynebacterium phocae]